MSSAIKSLALTARQHGMQLSIDRLQHDYGVGDDEVDDKLLVKMAVDNGLKAKHTIFNWNALTRLGKAFPVIARLGNGTCVVLTGYTAGSDELGTEETVSVLDPGSPNPAVEKVGRELFMSHWNGSVVLIKRQYRLSDEDRPFSVGWIFAEYLKQKILIGQLFMVAMILHMFAVLPAVFIMIVLDKVVNYKALSTLYVIAIGVVIAYLFNGILGYLRQYIILFTTSKLDVRLNTKVFSKLLDLPLAYFQEKPLSAISKTVQQTVSLRQILTGRFFSAILDSTSLLVFIPILFFYSPLLCAIVIGFAILISTNVIIASRYQKGKLTEAAAADGAKQAVLMNSVSGIETVKSLALEPMQKREWEEAIANHIVANLELGKVNAISAQISSTLLQLMTVAVIFVGVQLVFADELSAGILIGVNMMASRVTGPLVQLVTLVTDYEKVTVAIQSLASIMNTRGEVGRQGMVTDIVGGIEFKGVSYTHENGTKILDNVSFKIEPRQRVAIVGRAGSGKSTLARLIQGLMPADEGIINIDDHNIQVMDKRHLRVSISAITQDSSLFKASIRENIIKPYPGATMAQVHWAAKMVGLHSEVESLSDGYETVLDEGGANLSVGQRQKIALARALIRNPRVLILDEAFSIFDVESEVEIRSHMPQIKTGRTIISITNRTSQAMDCELILVMDKGKIVATGDHASLSSKAGIYRTLWEMENQLMGERLAPPVHAETRGRA